MKYTIFAYTNSGKEYIVHGDDLLFLKQISDFLHLNGYNSGVWETHNESI